MMRPHHLMSRDFGSHADFAWDQLRELLFVVLNHAAEQKIAPRNRTDHGGNGSQQKRPGSYYARPRTRLATHSNVSKPTIAESQIHVSQSGCRRYSIVAGVAPPRAASMTTGSLLFAAKTRPPDQREISASHSGLARMSAISQSSSSQTNNCRVSWVVPSLRFAAARTV